MVLVIQNSIPSLYDPRVKVIPCSVDRVPHLPVEIIYLIAQKLPRPKSVLHLARVNRNSWHYLQPVLFECEVTYEARLVAAFGDGRRDVVSQVLADRIYRGRFGGPPPAEDRIEDNQEKCQHGLWTAVCEECEERIAIRNRSYKATLNWNESSRMHGSRGMTALHWACLKGAIGLPAALKALRAASVHQPSYINGMGLTLRHYNAHRLPFVGELPPPLFMAVAFGNVKLCKALIEFGCNVNLLQPELCGDSSLCDLIVQYKIHRGCARRDRFGMGPVCYWSGYTPDTCETAGHVAARRKRPYILKLLLDAGLDPLLGEEPLIHTAVKECNPSVVKVLLDRYPELSQLCWKDQTPLHSISNMRPKPTKKPLEKLKAIISFRVEKGANLEAQLPYSIGTGEMVATPLEAILRKCDHNMLYFKMVAPEALIDMGAVWHQTFPLGTSTFLDQCISDATLWSWDQAHPCTTFATKNRLAYARLVKAMVRSTSAAGPEKETLQNGVSPMDAVLRAFHLLAQDSIDFRKKYDPWATEAVGKLLLSTGITPIPDLFDAWVGSTREAKSEKTSCDDMRRRWEDLISGRADEDLSPVKFTCPHKSTRFEF